MKTTSSFGIIVSKMLLRCYKRVDMNSLELSNGSGDMQILLIEQTSAAKT